MSVGSLYRGYVGGKGKKRRFHVAVAEDALGRSLPMGAEVHHVDGNGLNNDHSNLVICQDIRYHRFLHFRARIVRAGGNPNTDRICTACGQLFPISQKVLAQRSHGSHKCSPCTHRGWVLWKARRGIAA
jgi:hypothetical protein